MTYFVNDVIHRWLYGLVLSTSGKVAA